jgi:hypothetical protein
MMPLDVLLAALTAYSKTIDLIASIRADMTPEQRQAEWTRHFARVEWWENTMKGLLPKEEEDLARVVAIASSSDAGYRVNGLR